MAKKGLGKGLSALISEDFSIENEEKSGVAEIKITQIEPDPEQPRKDFDQEKLDLLANSIKIHGVIQPLIVTEQSDGFYRIIAGERRWRAAKLAGLPTVPAVVRTYSREQSAEIALVENLQREDLNGIEEARGYKTLMDEFSLTQQQVAEKVGKSRPAVANALRLLNLPENVQDMVIYGEISSGHARAISGINDPELQTDLAQKVIAEDLSVRQIEKLIAQLDQPQPEVEKVPVDLNLKAQLKGIQTDLQSYLGTKVKVVSGKNKGKIEIEYYDMDELERVIELIKR
ncbi:MAG: ParB/RepB/Spo0J family partition protein [Ruminococcaceae bacterium]|nr:ParB/RepB/Spo0J family partition protein [Oscillospiraceae bacterium]